MNGVVNPYTILGFFPDQSPSIKEIKSRYRFLAKVHHPDHGGLTEVFRAINDAHAWVIQNANPGPAFFKDQSPKSPLEKGWRTSDKGNWIYVVAGDTNATVFQIDGKWKWVFHDQWSKKAFSTAEEAITNFEDECL